MTDGPDEKVTTPAMAAVNADAARVDRLEAKLDAHIKESAERFGKLSQKTDDASEKCAGDHAMLREQVAANASAAKGLEGRIGTLESWRPQAEAAAKRASDIAAEAKQVANDSVARVDGTEAGLMKVIADSEKATEEREAEKKAERDEAARVAKVERETAQAAHNARFDAQGDAIKRQGDAVDRQGEWIVKVGEGVTALSASVGKMKETIDKSAARASTYARWLIASVALLIVFGGGVITCAVVSSRTDVVRIGVAK